MTFTSRPTVTTSLALGDGGDAEATVAHKFPGTPSTTVRVTTAGSRVMVDVNGDFVGGDADVVVYVNGRSLVVFPSDEGWSQGQPER